MLGNVSDELCDNFPYLKLSHLLKQLYIFSAALIIVAQLLWLFLALSTFQNTMNKTPLSKIEQARNLFLGLSESFIKDSAMVDEYLQEEGHNLDDIDNEGLELWQKIELSHKMMEASVKKQSLFEAAKTHALQLMEKVKSNTESFLGQNEEQALRLALHRDFKGELSSEDIESIMHNQSILALLDKNSKANESNQRPSPDCP